MVYGYHRTSTEEQHLDRGINAINDYCSKNGIRLDEMFTDQQTGKDFNRPDYQAMKRMAKNRGDIIIVSELDRLGRSKEDTLKELRHFKEKGVRIMILEIPTTLVDYSLHGDTLSSMLMETINNMLIEMYATFAHAEMIKREKRQREGIQAKKDRGEWNDYGRPPVVADNELNEFRGKYMKLCEDGLNATQIMSSLRMKKTSFYKYRKLVLDSVFPQLYSAVISGEIAPQDCMAKLGLKYKEYNEYVYRLNESSKPNCASNTKPQVDSDNESSVETDDGKKIDATAQDLNDYIKDARKQLFFLYDSYISNNQVTGFITRYLDYLPSMTSATEDELFNSKQKLQGNISVLIDNLPKDVAPASPIDELLFAAQKLHSYTVQTEFKWQDLRVLIANLLISIYSANDTLPQELLKLPEKLQDYLVAIDKTTSEQQEIAITKLIAPLQKYSVQLLAFCNESSNHSAHNEIGKVDTIEALRFEVNTSKNI